MLRQVAEGVLIHESDFMQSNSVVVQGGAGVLLIDAGIRGDEIASIANDLREWATTLRLASRRIHIGTTCSGTPGSARHPATARLAARLPSKLGCRTPIGRPPSPA